MMRLALAAYFLGFQACWGAIAGMTVGQLPVAFEPNRGQWSADVGYGAHVGGHLYAFSRKGIVIDGAVHLELVSTSRGKFEALDPVEAKTNYLKGRDPKKWIIGVRNYSRIRYRSAFPGIDLVLYGSQGQLEFDYLIAPGASPDVVQFRVSGASLQESAGNIELVTSAGERIELRAPVAYQKTASGRRAVQCRYHMRRQNVITFDTSGFDPSLPIVIDPVLMYLTGVGGTDTVTVSTNPMVTDADGNFYVAGTLSYASLPITKGALRAKSICPPEPAVPYGANCSDGFAMKFSSQRGLIWSTYIGGSELNTVTSIGLDASGNEILGGFTCGRDFPITPDAYLQTMPPGRNYHCAGFLAKLNPTGTALAYATFLEVGPDALRLDTHGDIYCIGFDPSGVADIQKMSPDGKTLLMTFPLTKSGTGPVSIGSITLDNAGNIYVLNPRWPGFQVTPGAHKDSDNDAEVILKYDPLGNLVFAASVNASDNSRDIAVDAAGNVVFAGKAGAGFPVVDDPDPQPNNCEPGKQCTAYVAALDPTGSFLRYTRLLGEGEATKLAFDSNGDLWVAGSALNVNSISSGFFPRTRDAFQYCSSPMDESFSYVLAHASLGWDTGPANTFIARLDSMGNRKFSSFTGTFEGTISYLQLSASGQLYLGGLGAEGFLEYFHYFHAVIDTTKSPRIPHACLVNATQNIIDANPAKPTIAPGEMVTLFGEGLGPLEPVNGQWNDAGALSTQLAGVQVLFDGIPAPVLYAQYNQINCIVPFGVASNQTTTVVAQYNGLQTDPMTFQVAPAVVNVFTRNQWPGADVIAVNEDGTMNSADHPAARGSVITLYATGGGLVGVPLQDGQIVHDASSTLSPLSVHFFSARSEEPAEVQYFGTAPGQVAGIYQLNVKVPLEAVTGRTYIGLHSSSWGVEGIWLK